jgi:outer membrane protein
MRSLITVALMLLVTTVAQSQTLTLQDAVQRALSTHPAIGLSQANVDRAVSAIREASAARLPSLSFESNLTRFQEPMVVAPLHGFDPRNPPTFDRTLSQSSATFAYSLFDASRGARVSRARELSAAVASSADATRMQVLADVTRAYLRVRSAREVAEAHQRRIAALERERDRAQQMVEQGRAARVVLLRSQAALSAAGADAILATNDVEVAEHELARMLNVKTDSIARLAIAPLRLVNRELAAVTRDHNPDLIRARREIAAAEAGRVEASASRLPRLNAGARFIEYASPDSRAQGEWQGGVQLSYSVFSGGARSAAADRAAAELRAAQAQYELVARAVDQAIDRALSAFNAAHARVKALEAAVAQSEEVTRIDRLALDAGAGVQSDYLNAEADLFRARAALTDARALELSARVELARISGQLDENWIAANVETYR